MNYKYEFTNKVKEQAILDQIPPTQCAKIEQELPFKFVLLRNHFMDRLNQRLLKNVTEMDEKKWIAQQVIKNRGKHHFTFSKKRPNHFMIQTKIGNVPVKVVLVHDKLKDVYFALTIYIDLTEQEWKQIASRFKVEKEEKRFEAQLKNKSNDFEKALNDLPVVEKPRKIKDKIFTRDEPIMDEYQTQEWLDSLDDIIIVDEKPKPKKVVSDVKLINHKKQYVIDSFDGSSLLDEAEMFEFNNVPLLSEDEEDFSDDDQYFDNDDFDIPLGLDISADDFPWDD